MLSQGHEASHHILSPAAVLPGKNKFCFRSFLVYSYYFVALKITPTQIISLEWERKLNSRRYD